VNLPCFDDKRRKKGVKKGSFLIIPEISRSDISGITTKAPCEAALMALSHERIEISDFVMRTFVHFPGMNAAITLKPHQKDAVARQILAQIHCLRIPLVQGRLLRWQLPSWRKSALDYAIRPCWWCRIT